MKKNKLLMLVICFIIIACAGSVVFAESFLPSKPTGGTIPVKITTTTNNIWATISYIVQIISVACVVFAGVRYMFASADQRADLKKGLINIVIGAILVFGAITIIQVVATII